MKRLLLLAALLVGCAAVSMAQTEMQRVTTDVIYTTDGIILQGTIVEQVPGVKYTITTLEGKTYTVDALSIERITREVITRPLLTENYNYNYNPYIACHFDENGDPIFPLRPGTAFARSLVVPGLGQMYNGEFGKGVLLFTGAIAGILGATLGAYYCPSKYESLVGWGSVALLGGCYVYSLIDAPIVAMRWNRQHGFKFNGDSYIEVAPAIGVGRDPHHRRSNASLGVGVSVKF